MSSVEIIDNFLPVKEFESLVSLIIDTEFPWYLGNKVDYTASNSYSSPVKGYECIVEKQKQLRHVFIHEEWGNNSPVYWEGCIPIANKLKTNNIYRAKVNLTFTTGKQTVGGWHRDVDYDKDIKVAIFYLNTNNGFTLLEDGTEVISKANRLAIHKNLLHTDVTQTDTDTRFVLNIVYD